MGLAPYGEPEFMNEMRKVVKEGNDKSSLFELDLNYFIHHSKGVTMSWDNGTPEMGPVFSKKLVELFGPPRRKGEELTQRHKNIAHSLQKMLNNETGQCKYQPALPQKQSLTIVC